jgi:hypothetical protein
LVLEFNPLGTEERKEVHWGEVPQLARGGGGFEVTDI